MLSTLVTGANGFIGKSLCAELSKQKFAVRVATRTECIEINDLERVAIGLIDANTDWSASLQDIDVVIHLAARVHVMEEKVDDPLTEFRKINVEGTLNLARQAANLGVKRLVFISSIKVNGECTALNKPFYADDQAQPEDAYGLSKFEAEEGLKLLAKKTGMDVIIIRPPLVYGEGVNANFANMMAVVMSGLPLPLGAIHNRRSYVYVENLVSLIVCCIDHPATANQTFLVSDGHDFSTTDLLRSCATALGVKSRLLPLPQKLVEFCAALLGKRILAQRLCGNLQIDMSKTCALLDWQPPFTVEEGLQATAQTFIKAEHN